MVSRNVIIVIVILILVALGFYFLTNMTGNVITGSVVDEAPSMENEYFKIDPVGYESNGAGGEVNSSEGDK